MGKFMGKFRFTFMISAALLTACGDSGSDGANNNEEGGNTDTTAFFIDSGVAGLNYSSTSHQGVTDSNGGFLFSAGETTTFSYLGVQLGSILTPSGISMVTPLDLFSTTDVNNLSVKNTLVFLQSLDNDQNPDNGISLSTRGTLPDLQSLDIHSANFQSQLLSEVSAIGVTTLVSESDALDHFNDTLALANAAPNIIGKWVIRNAVDGDVSGVMTFSDDQTLTAKEFEDCSNNDIFWTASEASAMRHCSSVNLTANWTLSGNQLSMFNDTLSDNCTIISSSTYFIEANCSFQGSGLGTELTRFERDLTQLSDHLISKNYREVSAGRTSFSELTFNDDLSGSYVYHNSEGVAQSGPGDQGNYTWSMTGDQLTVGGIDNNAEQFSLTWTLQNDMRGTLVVSAAESTEGTEAAALLPNFNDQLAKDLIYQTIFGVYDAISGACKHIYVINNYSSGDSSSKPLRKESSVGVNDDICDFATPIAAPETGDTGVYSMTIKNGAFVIERGSEREVCWPISYSRQSDASDFFALACSTDTSTAFKLEIWRGL